MFPKSSHVTHVSDSNYVFYAIEGTQVSAGQSFDGCRESTMSGLVWSVRLWCRSSTLCMPWCLDTKALSAHPIILKFILGIVFTSSCSNRTST